MARHWTPEERAKQSALIHNWKPWQHSTGACTPEGKAKASRNAYRFTMRKAWLFSCWLLHEKKKLLAGKPYASRAEIIQCAKHCHGGDATEYELI